MMGTPDIVAYLDDFLCIAESKDECQWLMLRPSGWGLTKAFSKL